MQDEDNDVSHVNKLGIVGLEYDGTFFWGKINNNKKFADVL